MAPLNVQPVALATFLATQRGLSTFSDLDARDHSVEKQCVSYYRSVGSEALSAYMHQLLHHRTYLAGRRIASVHSIILHQRNGTPCYLAIASDTIGHQPLMSSDNLSLFHGFFLGIVQTDPTDGSPFPTLTEHRPADLPKNGTDGNNSHIDLGFPDVTEAPYRALPFSRQSALSPLASSPSGMTFPNPFPLLLAMDTTNHLPLGAPLSAIASPITTAAPSIPHRKIPSSTPSPSTPGPRSRTARPPISASSPAGKLSLTTTPPAPMDTRN